jgi:hypothetical protein
MKEIIVDKNVDYKRTYKAYDKRQSQKSMGASRQTMLYSI